jgi:hypothetical protein
MVSSWDVDEVANLERGGRLERVKPVFSLGKTLKGTGSPA